MKPKELFWLDYKKDSSKWDISELCKCCGNYVTEYLEVIDIDGQDHWSQEIVYICKECFLGEN